MIALLAAVGQSRQVPVSSSESSEESLASLLLAVTPAVTPRSLTPRIPASRQSSPSMIVDPNDLAASSMMLADFPIDPRLLVVGAAPATAASWALFNIGKSAFNQFKYQFEAEAEKNAKIAPKKASKKVAAKRVVRQAPKAAPKKVAPKRVVKKTAPKKTAPKKVSGQAKKGEAKKGGLPFFR